MADSSDSLVRNDPKSQELAYNNTTDRMKVELPQAGSPGASGVVLVVSASGTPSIPVYLTSPIPVAVAVDIQSDSIKVFSASGTAELPVYFNLPVTITEPDPTSSKLISKKFSYNANGDVSEIKEALVATPSGSPCKVSSFTYTVTNDVDYIVESLGTW